MKRLVPIILVLALGLAACDNIDPGVTLTTAPPGETTTTAAPEETTTTAAPEETTTTTEATEEAPPVDDDAPWWLLVIAGLALLIIVVALVRRGSKKNAAPKPATNWKSHARAAYAESRWLYDAMAEDLAVWRGNAQFDGTSAVGSSAGTGQAEAWTRLQASMASATNALYQLEATAPDNRALMATRRTIESMNSTRAALDARAESRYAYRKADADGVEAHALVAARDHEVRASRNLTDARNAFGAALTDFATLV